MRTSRIINLNSTERRRYCSLARMDTKQFGRSIGAPWSNLYFKVYKSLRRGLKDTDMWGFEMELLCQTLTYSYVKYRKAVVEGSAKIVWEDEPRWTWFLQRVKEAKDKVRETQLSEKVAATVVGAIEDTITDIEQQKSLIREIRRRLSIET